MNRSQSLGRAAGERRTPIRNFLEDEDRVDIQPSTSRAAGKRGAAFRNGLEEDGRITAEQRLFQRNRSGMCTAQPRRMGVVCERTITSHVVFLFASLIY